MPGNRHVVETPIHFEELMSRAENALLDGEDAAAIIDDIRTHIGTLQVSFRAPEIGEGERIRIRDELLDLMEIKGELILLMP